MYAPGMRSTALVSITLVAHGEYVRLAAPEWLVESCLWWLAAHDDVWGMA